MAIGCWNEWWRASTISDMERSSSMGKSREFPKRESSEWTDEKHSLYLKSMEASFVDQLYNSLDMRSWQAQNEYSSDAMSDMRHHASTRPSGQFKVLQHGSWSRIDFKRENYARNENNRPHISSSNPWIQHFRNGNGHRDAESPSSQEKPSSTSFSNTEVTDQNFVQEVPDIQTVKRIRQQKKKEYF
ncbi:hypothetical protein Tco_1145260 [Tanacetum coccineum]